GEDGTTNFLPDLRQSGKLNREAYIRALYRVLLQREPDPTGFQRFLDRDDSSNLFREFLRSTEFRAMARSPAYAAAGKLGPSRRSRVLLFGAYGNGNLGDAIQALSFGSNR